MILEVRAPEANDEVAEATILSWMKQHGDHVNAGEVLCEIEFGKTMIEVEAETSGILCIVVNAGTMVPASELIGTISTDG
jgi:pyruvate/2-oxoglutarate dehydrogenase complex dihydrolipoamide acyltransferase (E2) component